MPRLMAALVVALASGCTHYIGTFGLVWKTRPPIAVQELGEVRGQHCNWFEPAPDLDAAFGRAIRQQPEADALADVVIAVGVQNYIVVSRVCVRIDGTAVRVGEP